MMATTIIIQYIIFKFQILTECNELEILCNSLFGILDPYAWFFFIFQFVKMMYCLTLLSKFVYFIDLDLTGTLSQSDFAFSPFIYSDTFLYQYLLLKFIFFLCRENGHEGFDINLEQPKRSTKHGEVIGSIVFAENLSAPTSDVTTGLNRIGEAALLGEAFRSKNFPLESFENGKYESLGHVDDSQGDLQPSGVRAGDDLDKAENVFTENSSLVLSLLKTDPLIWKPPEAANIEDDIDSVANNDDDDDYSDGTKWGQSTSLSDFDKVDGNSYKEARQKAMVAAMNGQFKILVSRFLASEGLASMDDGHDLGWLDVVTSLSWEAALFIKPDAKEGRAMDPGSYVKVKCVATAARNQR